jgi:hypothetical protein
MTVGALALLADRALSLPEVWLSPCVERRLLEELRQPVAVVTGALPAWTRLLPRLAPFLFSAETRHRSLTLMGFGVSRAIVALQEGRGGYGKLQAEFDQANMATSAYMDAGNQVRGHRRARLL